MSDELPKCPKCEKCLCTDCVNRCELCNGCRNCNGDSSVGYRANFAKGEHAGEYLCEPCAVKEWSCPISFHFHPGVSTEVRKRFQTGAMLRRLTRWFGREKHFPVHVFHRKETETLFWQTQWNNASHGRNGTMPRNPYSFRGWCSGLEIVLIWNEAETPDSMEWLLYHELAHHACNGSYMIDQAMAFENKNEGRDTYDWENDAGHEADSEERLVNRIATAYMGGREYARPWWRPRANALQNEEDTLPDPFASVESDAFAKAALILSYEKIPGVDVEALRIKRFEQMEAAA